MPICPIRKALLRGEVPRAAPSRRDRTSSKLALILLEMGGGTFRGADSAKFPRSLRQSSNSPAHFGILFGCLTISQNCRLCAYSVRSRKTGTACAKASPLRCRILRGGRCVGHSADNDAVGPLRRRSMWAVNTRFGIRRRSLRPPRRTHSFTVCLAGANGGAIALAGRQRARARLVHLLFGRHPDRFRTLRCDLSHRP